MELMMTVNDVQWQARIIVTLMALDGIEEILFNICCLFQDLQKETI